MFLCAILIVENFGMPLGVEAIANGVKSDIEVVSSNDGSNSLTINEEESVSENAVSQEDADGTEPVSEDNRKEDDSKAVLEFEPETEEAIDLIIPKYITSLIYGAMIESVASENGARMQAMDNATSNADEMIENLSLLYNRARQGSITQELTEIIAGADAIS